MKVTLLDTECASLKGGIVQIANLITDENLSEIKESRCTLVNPLCKIGYGAMGVHFIRDAPKFADIAQEYIPTEGYLIAHNAPFDVRMLEEEGYTLTEGVKVLDTLELARELVHKNSCENHQLGTLYHYYKAYEDMGNYEGQAHDALYDCHLLFYTLKRMLAQHNLTLDEAYASINTPIQNKPCDMKKYRDSGKTWAEIYDEAPDYCQWLLDNYDFKYHKFGKELKSWLESVLS